jgi:hypothetical protein
MSSPESRFTAPRADCPNPHYWNSDDADSTEHEVSVLVGAFVTALQPEYVVETGTAFGQTAEAIGKALKDNGHGRLVSLEPDTQRAQFSRDRCEGLPVEILEVESMSFTPDAEIDFAWFDSLIHLRAEELKRYLPFMSKRAVVGFHDTGPHHQTRNYLNEIIRSGLITNPLWLPTPRGACFARVRGGLW